MVTMMAMVNAATGLHVTMNAPVVQAAVGMLGVHGGRTPVALRPVLRATSMTMTTGALTALTESRAHRRAAALG